MQSLKKEGNLAPQIFKTRKEWEKASYKNHR